MLVRLCLPLFLFSSVCAYGQLLEQLLASDTSKVIKQVLKDPDSYRLQIIYTEITEKKSFWGKAQLQLTTHYFRNKPNEYFFPASLVKMPVSALALEQLNILAPQGINENTPFAPLSDFQCVGKTQASSPQTTRDLINKIFVYSDN